MIISGNYAGFDETQPTSETGGKKVVVEGLIKKHGYKKYGYYCY